MTAQRACRLRQPRPRLHPQPDPGLTAAVPAAQELPNEPTGVCDRHRIEVVDVQPSAQGELVDNGPFRLLDGQVTRPLLSRPEPDLASREEARTALSAQMRTLYDDEAALRWQQRTGAPRRCWWARWRR